MRYAATRGSGEKKKSVVPKLLNGGAPLPIAAFRSLLGHPKKANQYSQRRVLRQRY